MNEYKDISELLESDSRAMAFYNSLSLPMQRRLHSTGVRNLKELYDCASACSGADTSCSTMNTASASESTGCVPAGGDMSAEEWEDSRGLSH